MAMIKCPECEKEISDTAKLCPHCGYKIKSPLKKGKALHIILAMCAILVVALVTFWIGNKKPSAISDEAYEEAERAIKIVDRYIDGEIDVNELCEKLDGITYSTDENEEYADDDYVGMCILGLQIDASGIKFGTVDTGELKESRDELAKKINYRE